MCYSVLVLLEKDIAGLNNEKSRRSTHIIRKIVAFVGGLDLCDGRYDTPQHPLFRTLQTEYRDDYHNPTYTGNVIGCPREPWHDLHSKIDCPAAYDVLTNFEERWFKASKPQGLKKLKKTYDDALLRIEIIEDIIRVADYPRSDDNDPESWHVQIFRSIDSNSVKDFPKDPKQATAKNLVCGKNVLIDMSIHTAYMKAIRATQHFIYIENQYFIGSSYNWNSHKDLGAMSIHTAYVKAIRAAQHFIYIENQYFIRCHDDVCICRCHEHPYSIRESHTCSPTLYYIENQYFIGSSYNWNSHKDLGANNLIPMEIVLKIAQKIRPHERFAAYIVVPMWPEGAPTGAATQRILYWQMVSINKDELNGVGVATYKKPMTNECYEQRSQQEPPLCAESDDPNAAWSVPLQACMHKVPIEPLERGFQSPEQ